jgi:two-component SAPR family response regulator
MVLYISIDGDDTGNKITKSYLENNEQQLSQIIQDLNSILTDLEKHLQKLGAEIIFCAADGITCKGETLDIEEFSRHLKSVGARTYTFSAGIGNSLQTSYFALRYAKATGKNRSAICKDGKTFSII